MGNRHTCGIAGLILFALVGCSGDSQVFTEAAEANRIGLKTLTITSIFGLDEDIVVRPGETIQFNFKAEGQQGEEVMIENNDVNWGVSNNGFGSIGRSGQFSAIANGDVIVSLSFASIEATPMTVKVSDAALQSITEIEGLDTLTECSRSDEYIVTGRYENEDDDRRVRDLEWSIIEDNPGQPSGKLLVNDSEKAVVGGLMAGKFTLVAKSEDQEDTKEITVGSGLESLTIVPDPAPVELTATLSLAATARYTTEANKPEQRVEDLVSWSVPEDNGIATVSNATGSEGVLTAVSTGFTTVTGRCGELATSVEVNVAIPTTFSQLLIEPDDPLELTVGGSSEQLTITARSANDANIDVTDLATYTIESGMDVIDVTRTGTERGEVTPLRAGTAIIEVEYQNVKNSLTVRVR